MVPGCGGHIIAVLPLSHREISAFTFKQNLLIKVSPSERHHKTAIMHTSQLLTIISLASNAFAADGYGVSLLLSNPRSQMQSVID